MKLANLLRISAATLLGNPSFPVRAWETYSKKSYYEPIVVRDGFHDFVLMGAPDYEEMQKAHAALDGFSPEDRREISDFLSYMRARAEVHAEHAARRAVACRCEAAGKIVCQPSDRC